MRRGEHALILTKTKKLIIANKDLTSVILGVTAAQLNVATPMRVSQANGHYFFLIDMYLDMRLTIFKENETAVQTTIRKIMDKYDFSKLHDIEENSHLKFLRNLKNTEKYNIEKEKQTPYEHEILISLFENIVQLEQDENDLEDMDLSTPHKNYLELMEQAAKLTLPPTHDEKIVTVTLALLQPQVERAVDQINSLLRNLKILEKGELMQRIQALKLNYEVRIDKLKKENERLSRSVKRLSEERKN